MKRLLPALLAMVVVSLSFVHVGLGADRGCRVQDHAREREAPSLKRVFSYRQDGPWRYEVTWGNGGHPVSRGKYRYDPFPDDRRFDPLPGPVNDPFSLRRRP